jgi:hypothetical protein
VPSDCTLREKASGPVTRLPYGTLTVSQCGTVSYSLPVVIGSEWKFCGSELKSRVLAQNFSKMPSSPANPPLSTEDIVEAIKSTCDEVSNKTGWTLRLASDADLSKPATGSTPSCLIGPTRLLFGFVATLDIDPAKIEHLSTFNIDYSTWDGRVLGIDQVASKQEDCGDATLTAFLVMAAVAVRLQCARCEVRVVLLLLTAKCCLPSVAVLTSYVRYACPHLPADCLGNTINMSC